MSNLSNYINELKTAEAFSRQSKVFDDLYSRNTIIQYKRKRVRDHVMCLLPAQASILELNCGTGEDAIYFAQHGHSVHATDISEDMIRKLQEKLTNRSCNNHITTEVCSFTQLSGLEHKGPYDMIFSNFGGLNCTSELKDVLSAFSDLVKPGGYVTLVIIPEFCLWEFLLLFKGQIKTATRRFFSKGGRTAHMEGAYFKCWYYNPDFIIRQLKKSFQVQKLEGLCTLVPPSYMEGFAEKYPKLFHCLVKKENQFKAMWPWRVIGDYFIISLKRKATRVHDMS